MKAMRVLLSIGLVMAMAVRADDLRIQSFNGTGQLAFNELTTATTYRVEWAQTPVGCWSNTCSALDAIAATGYGSKTCSVPMCSVPMCYRVVATVTNASTPPDVSFGMVLIPAGTNSGTDPDTGAYSLTVSAFCMDSTLVTKAKWDEVYTWALAHGYSFTNAGSGKATNHPVHTVSWHDSAKWCNARSEKEGRPGCYRVGGTVYRGADDDSVFCYTSIAGYRLPTEVEFEYAARGGLSGKRFPWGDTIDHTQANYYGAPNR